MHDIDPKDVFSGEYHRFLKLMMTIIGIWPYQNRRAAYLIRAILFIFVQSAMLAQLARTIEEWGKNIQIVAENVTGFIYFEGILVKYVIHWFEPKYQCLYETIAKQWMTIQDREEKYILELVAQQGRFYSAVFSLFISVCAVLFVAVPALIPLTLDFILPLNETRPKILCYYAEYFVDLQEFYYRILVHAGFCIAITILIIMTVDSTYLMCAMHVIALFNIVNYRLNKAFELVKDKNGVSKATGEKVHEIIFSSFLMHKKSIEFFTILQETYFVIFFLGTIFMLLALSIGTVSLVINIHGELGVFIKQCVAYLGFVVYLFFVSLPGEMINNTSFTIMHSIYFCGWYNFPLQTQHFVRFMLMRTIKPCNFTAGPLIVMNFASCGAVVRMSMSYCAFMLR